MTTLYIAPSGTYGPSGQCRIYASESAGRYEDRPSDWHEVGLMDSAGRVRCISPEFADLRHDEPLMAGSYWPMG